MGFPSHACLHKNDHRRILHLGSSRTVGPHMDLAPLDSELGPGDQFSATVSVLCSAHSPAGLIHSCCMAQLTLQGPGELSESQDHRGWKGSPEGSNIPPDGLHVHVLYHHLNPEGK